MKKALKIALNMFFTILLTLAVCALIWWIYSDHTHYRLGQYFSVGGIVVFISGILIGATHLTVWATEPMDDRYEKLRVIADKFRKLRYEDINNTRVMLFLCGVGLICILIGLLINPGM